MIFIEQLPSLFQYHKSSKQLNLQAITVWVTKQRFMIVPNLNRSRIPTVLEIDRKSKTIKEHQYIKEEEYKSAKPHFFSCLIGIFDLNGKKIIILAEEVNIIGNIGQRDIFKISKTIYLFYDPQEKKTITEKEAEILLNITTIFEQGMYFSFSYDLALRMNSTSAGGQDKSLFNWAHYLQKDLNSFDPMWRISVIQGFVGRLELHINGLKLNIVLISRRAVKRGGTQSFARGIDADGNAGNYVETEQIIFMKDHYFSFLQCRGAVPVFWSEIKSTYGFVNVKFEGNIEENFAGFKKHLHIIHKRADYQDIFLLNLLASSKEEKKLVENYEYLIRKFAKEMGSREEVGCEVRYAYFDIHANCGNKDYSKLNQFLENSLKEVINYCNFTALRVDRVEKKMEVLNNQTGILRSNCYNCIDRTNIAQSRIAALKLMEILNYLEIEINVFKNGLAFISQNSSFSTLYRGLWADNGDALSKQYTGTGSTESFAVRKGKLSYLTTLDHGMKSIFRAIRNIRNDDHKKQQAIRMIVGASTNDLRQPDQIPNEGEHPDHKIDFNNNDEEYDYRKLEEKELNRRQMDK